MADVAVPTFKRRTTKSNARKRPATPPPASDSEYTEDEESGTRIKRRKKDGVQVSSVQTGPVNANLSKYTAFTADRTAGITANDHATKTSHWYTESANEADAARASAASKRDMQAQAVDGNYKGSTTYSTFIQKGAESRGIGPTKAPTNVRMITVTDFAPDVCKDYKQTGFCGFGDGCKFLHAREDYKQGWQIDKEWDNAAKGKNKKVEPKELDAEEKMLESIPFKCIICKEDYKRPVVTKCGHYFCEKCAMTRYMKEKKKTCANCGADTSGTFNTARKLNDLLDRKRKRAAENDANGEKETGDT